MNFDGFGAEPLDRGFQRQAQTAPPAQRQKRSRVLLSCRPCRTSKLKCDRQEPCSQCVKKDRQELCKYAPKPEKRGRMPKSMSSRLQHLEGVVRSMMDADPDALQKSGATHLAQAMGRPSDRANQPTLQGQVVRGHNAGTAYIGETHCMAMLEDIEDLRAYFDDSEDEDDGSSPHNDLEAPDMLIQDHGGSVTREDLLAQLPDRQVADRLITRYFECMSPSQHVIHRPTFTRTYARFRQDPNSASLHWIAQLFMMLALGIYYSCYQAPSEIEADSPITPNDRIKHYRICARWALVLGKYMQPNPATMPAFILYFESHFLFNRAAQMTSYILSGVCMRLMMKMGMHRDPSKLAGITPFEGEMRRRQWNMGIQLETVVSFHVGLPGMTPVIESDTDLPRNLRDDDFDEDTKELPPSRPKSDWTPVSYPINKSSIMRVFAHISKQVHGLTPPTYSEVMRLDNILNGTWREVPSFLMVRPMDECVGELPALLIQRFGLAALYNKSRCVLHRRYLAEAVPDRQHDYSRQQCLEAATSLLKNQYIIWENSRPGRSLASHGWFISSLSVHDYLLAAMVLYIIIQNDHYGDPTDEAVWMSDPKTVPPTKDELKELILKSWQVWSVVAESTTEVRRTADTLALMLARLGSPVSRHPSCKASSPTESMTTNGEPTGSSAAQRDQAPASTGTFGSFPDPLSVIGQNGSSSGFSDTAYSFPPGAGAFPTTGPDLMPGTLDLDYSWMDSSMDWRNLDISLAHSHTADSYNEGLGNTWTERSALDARPAENIDAMGQWMGPNSLPEQEE